MSVASSGGAALAADVDVLAPVPMQQAAPQGPRWNGFSVGINGGGLWAPGQSEKQFWFPASLPTAGLPSAFSFSPRGLMAGAQVGFNKQWGDFVVGGVADFDIIGGAKSSVTSSGVYTGAPPPVPFTTAQSQQLQNLGTIRARVGRYWAMNAKGHVLFQDAASTGGPQVATFHTDLAQVFLQSAYHF